MIEEEEEEEEEEEVQASSISPSKTNQKTVVSPGKLSPIEKRHSPKEERNHVCEENEDDVPISQQLLISSSDKYKWCCPQCGDYNFQNYQNN